MSDIPRYSLKGVIPDEEGYYWWKEDYFKAAEIVLLEIDDGNISISRCGDERNWALMRDTHTGIFGSKIPKPCGIGRPTENGEY